MNNLDELDVIFQRKFTIEVGNIEKWIRQKGTFKSLQELRLEKRRKKLEKIIEKIKK